MYALRTIFFVILYAITLTLWVANVFFVGTIIFTVASVSVKEIIIISLFARRYSFQAEYLGFLL